MGGYLNLGFMKLCYNSLFISWQLFFDFSVKMGNNFENFKKQRESFEIIIDSKKRKYYLDVPDNQPNNTLLLFFFMVIMEMLI